MVGLQLERLRLRLRDREMALEMTDGAVEFVADAGCDPKFGARPIKRAIQTHLETPLARLIVEGKVRDGPRVKVVKAKGGLEFKVEEPAKA